MTLTKGSSIAWGSLLPSVGPPLPLPREIRVGQPVRAVGCTRLTTGSVYIPTEAPSYFLAAFTLDMTTSCNNTLSGQPVPIGNSIPGSVRACLLTSSGGAGKCVQQASSINQACKNAILLVFLAEKNECMCIRNLLAACGQALRGPVL